MDEDAAGSPLALSDGLVDEVDEPALEPPPGPAVEQDRDLGPDERLAGPMDAVEKLEEPLARKLGERLADRKPNNVLEPDKLTAGPVEGIPDER
jgi:hypothetical protein